METIAVVGGGAAGLVAAAAAAEELRRMECAEKASVVIYEADERVGRSILATGNGRCNFSNTRIDSSRYHNASYAGEVLQWFDFWAQSRIPSQKKRSTAYPNGVIGFFSDCGLMWREESEGRLYPLANKASSVLNVLRTVVDACGVQLQCGCCVERIEPPRQPGGAFTLRMADGRFERASRVIVAVGGRIASALLPSAVDCTKTKPVLGPLSTGILLVRKLDNIRVRCAVELWRPSKTGMASKALNDGGYLQGTHADEKLVARETGELMFRKYGVSGIVVFNMSRLAKTGDVLAVDFVPWIRLCDMEAFLNRRRKLLRSMLERDVTWNDMLCGMVVSPVAEALLAKVGLDGSQVVAKGQTACMAHQLKGLRLAVEGIGDKQQCQVMRGGVKTKGLCPQTCEVSDLAGLYVVGEAVDVDGPCGGYNLHWAWASGLLAGWNAADSLFAGDSRNEAVD